MSEGFVIVNPDRRRIAMAVLRTRLRMAVHFGQTDAVALDAARGWAAQSDPAPAGFRTMKQALAWVESVIEIDEAAQKVAKESTND